MRTLRQFAARNARIAPKVAALQTLLQETAAALQHSPRLVKLYWVLYHTCFQPAATQEQTAELLDLPFSTYRRHLRTGVAELISRLWTKEMIGQ